MLSLFIKETALELLVVKKSKKKRGEKEETKKGIVTKHSFTQNIRHKKKEFQYKIPNWETRNEDRGGATRRCYDNTQTPS